MGDLFGESELFDPGVPENEDSMMQARRIYAIHKLDEKLATLHRQAEEASQYYASETEKVLKNKDFLMAQVEAFLRYYKQKSIKTHLGGATLVERTKRIWPPSEQLLSWAKEKAPETITVTETVNLNHAKTFIDNNPGYSPEGYQEVTSETLQVKR